MARKEIYWKDPEKHRAEYRNRMARLRALGLGSLDHLSPPAKAKAAARKIKWCQTHRANNTIANRKYRRKLQRLFGNSANRSRWRHLMMQEEERARKRKKAAASVLPRLVVESRRRTLVAASRKRR